MDELLEPYDGIISGARNSTDRSRLCEKIIVSFLRNNANAASVKYQQTQYSIDEMHRSLHSICRKEPYKHLVAVSKRDGQLLLRRIDGGKTK